MQLPLEQALDPWDKPLTIAGIVLLELSLILHVATIITRVVHHFTGVRKLWVVRLLRRSEGSMLLFSPGITWTLAAVITCSGKVVHGLLNLYSSRHQQYMSVSTRSSDVILYFSVFTFNCLSAWLVWSSILVQGSQSLECFRQDAPQGSVSFIGRIARYWNFWIIGVTTIALVYFVTCIALVSQSYQSATVAIRHVFEDVEVPPSEEAIDYLHVAFRQAKTDIDRWLIGLLFWVTFTILTYGTYNAWLLVAFHRETQKLGQLKENILTSDISSLEADVASRDARLPFVADRHRVLKKKRVHLLLMFFWLFAFAIYIIAGVAWYMNLPVDVSLGTTITAKSSQVADKFGFGLFDFPLSVYILVSALRYKKKYNSLVSPSDPVVHHIPPLSTVKSEPEMRCSHLLARGVQPNCRPLSLKQTESSGSSIVEKV